MSGQLCTKCDFVCFETDKHDTSSMHIMVQSVRLDLARLLDKYHIDLDEELDFEVAVVEAIQNAFRHGKGKVTICVGYLNATMRAAITDQGAGVTHFKKEMPPIEQTGGRGFPVMYQCANVECVKRPNSFTVYLTKGLDNAVPTNATSGNGVH